MYAVCIDPRLIIPRDHSGTGKVQCSVVHTPGRYRWQLDALLIPGGNSSLGRVYKKHWNGSNDSKVMLYAAGTVDHLILFDPLQLPSFSFVTHSCCLPAVCPL